MDPILSLIKIFCEKKNIINDEETIDSFFENGISFPQFISLIFGIEQIPNIQKNPKTIFHKKANNDVTLQYLCQKNDFIRKSNPKLDTLHDRTNLLRIILSKLCFPVNIPDIIRKSNLLLDNCSIHNTNDLMNPLFILNLLDIVSEHKIQIEVDITQQNFNEIMSKNFKIAQVSFFINYESMKASSQDIFLIQIQFIFDAYSEKINNLLGNKPIKRTENIKQNESLKKTEDLKRDEIENNEKESLKNPKQSEQNEIENYESKSKQKSEQSKENQNEEPNKIGFYDKNNANEIENQSEIVDEDEENKILKIEYKYSEEEQLEEQSLLKTINFLTKKLFPSEKLNFTTFIDTLKNDFVPKFVMKFLENETIENFDLSRSSSKPDKVTNKDIKNIFATINFLKKLKHEYQILLFSFSTEIEREASAKLFFRSFLNLFFVTYSRTGMKRRLNIIASNSNDAYPIIKNPHYSLLIQSMKFLSQEPSKLNPNLSKMYEMCLDLFSIEKIFTEQHFFSIAQDKIYPDSYFYQLQLLFNEWETNSKSFHIAELFFITSSKIKKVSVPRYDVLASSIKAKKVSFDLMNHKSTNLNANESEDNKIQNENEIKSPLTFVERHKKDKKEQNEITQKVSFESFQNEMNEDSYRYWNPSLTYFYLDDRVIIKTMKSNEIACDYHDIMSTEIKSLLSPKMQANKQAKKLIKNLQKKSDFTTKLYKLFYYNEREKKWEFDSQSFHEFSVAKQINVGNSSTPLVFFANSKEEDEIIVSSHFLIGQHPDLKEEEIFVYAMCEKNLTMLHLNLDLKNQEKLAIKPIFLLLHVPKSKQNLPNIITIVMQIYVFLYCISDLSIVIINENTFYNQIHSTNFIYSIAQDNALFGQESTQFIDDKNHKENKEEEDIPDLNLNFLNEKLETIFLIKNESYDYDHELPQLINNNSKYNRMINGFHIRPKISLIDIDNIDTYENFLDDMTSILLNSKTRFVEVTNKFNCLSLSNMSSRYINYKLSNDLSQIKNMINDRFLSLKNHKLFENDYQKIVTQLYVEVNKFTPKFDIKFQSELNIDLFMLRKGASQINKEFFKSELNVSSSSNLNKIRNLLRNKHYISDIQQERIVRNHQKFLQNEFFDIIKSKCDDSLFTIVYDDNSDIVEEQMEKDKLILKEVFNDVNKYIDKRKEVVKIDAHEGSKKQTNYVLKETENLREIKVSLDIGKDLTSIIEQDF